MIRFRGENLRVSREASNYRSAISRQAPAHQVQRVRLGLGAQITQILSSGEWQSALSVSKFHTSLGTVISSPGSLCNGTYLASTRGDLAIQTGTHFDRSEVISL